MVCAVNGEPSSSNMWSALPWSGCNQGDAALGQNGVRDLAHTLSTVSTAAFCRVKDAGVADHVAVGGN